MPSSRGHCIGGPIGSQVSPLRADNGNMKQKRYTYVRIGDEALRAVRLAAGMVSEHKAAAAGGGCVSRIFVEVNEIHPVGAIVELDLMVPERGLFKANGIVEWSNDDPSEQPHTGMGIMLLEVSSAVQGTDAVTGTDGAAADGPPAQEPGSGGPGAEPGADAGAPDVPEDAAGGDAADGGAGGTDMPNGDGGG